MDKPTLNKTANALLIDPYTQTISEIKVTGVGQLHEILNCARIAATEAFWQTGTGRETMFFDERLQKQQIPQFGNTFYGFHHKLVDIQQHFPIIGKAIIMQREPNGEDCHTTLTTDHVGGLITFYIWKTKDTHKLN